MARDIKTVLGVHAPAPRVTLRALWLVTMYLALPLMAGLLAFDILVWWLADTIWGVCIALWCVF